METIYDFFAKPKDPKMYKGVQIGLASSDQVREWSHGEIRKPETINYRTFKPERDGLFCAKVFGPTKDYECNCGKYKRMKHRGVICEKCGVEVIQSKVRRERMAHIELSCPVSHIWFLKSLPSKIGNVLDLTLKALEKVLYFDSYVVIDPGETTLTSLQLLSDEGYHEAIDEFGIDAFEVGIGAEAILKLLEDVDLQAVYDMLREEISTTKSVAKRQKMSKRLKVVDAFLNSGLSPTNMIMTAIPVLPPDLRPLVPLEGGRFATSDLNDLYRRVINRNNRLKRLIDLNAPDIIVRNEKRMLQESVDVLFDNGRHGRVVTGTNKRPLKSLSDTLKGKQGRFRQNLLGKRVDYSGRTVITVGPDLRLHQCGLPKKMALELFKPFIYNYLEQKGLVSTVKSAKKMVEREEVEVWDALDHVVREYPIMLNRAPTLHRLGIQAFEPILIEGKAIQLHPLVCPAFNADFDGDQMAVHVPLSLEARLEARVLMLASNNILSPANGQPVIVPTQDIVLGIYYMTRGADGKAGEGTLFSSTAEVRSAFDSGELDLHAKIKVKIDGKLYDTTTGRILLWEIIPGDTLLSLTRRAFATKEDARKELDRLISTDSAAGSGSQGKKESSGDTSSSDSQAKKAFDKKAEKVGLLTRKEFSNHFQVSEIIANQLFELNESQYSEIIESNGQFNIFRVDTRKSFIPFNLVNRLMDKSSVRGLVDYAYRNIGLKETVILADRLKDIGYKYSTLGGLSICIDDMIIPEGKWDIIRKAEENVQDIKQQYSEGLITQGEKYNKVVDIWAKSTDDIADAMMAVMKNPGGPDSKEDILNAVYMMADSGARGSKDQMRQLAGMRGLMAKPSGEIIENPITACFREGLTVLQYFISTHGARKGLADTALKTANSGYLTRRLADVAQDCAVVEDDCGTLMGVDVESLLEGGEVIQSLGERILGRVVQADVIDPYKNEVIVKKGVELDEKIVEKIESAGVTTVRIRSVLTCKSINGVCAKCYGRDLAHGQTVEIGQAIGIMAAQSIGEPGTQLTMRTFHIGGTASRKVEVAEIKARVAGIAKFNENLNIVIRADGEQIVMNRKGGGFTIVGPEGRERAKEEVIYGATLLVKDGQHVDVGDVLATWDPFTTPIITEVSGRIKYTDIEVGSTVQEQMDPVTGKSSLTIIDAKSSDIRPQITIKDKDGKGVKLPGATQVVRYFLPVNAILMKSEEEDVMAGDVIAKLPRATTKTKDITGGLPRVAELFEVRKPKEPTVLSEIDGYVAVAKGTKGKQKVTVTPTDIGDKKEYLIPKGRHLSVYDGDYVKAGEPLIGGSANPQDILNIKGEVALARYLVDEVQEVYRLQGVRINDKHIEVIISQMMRRVKVIDVGDTKFIPDEQVDRVKFAEENRQVVMKGGEPARGEPLILGITKASLATDSFISAASFQETTKVLTEASIQGRYDDLRGLKENVIMGRLIPAGTGFPAYKNISIDAVDAR
ncbi:DNA-directed RNA polymerase subunit beta' [Desulfamplus magnetovallimortis]|uniref:DNA-directed RNA polymerase subunit beta' n=1 Tax=Desulfamplus magnetovallimortis TaxID=1246637 RepID=A0A1W1H5X7_9BACT|nr:DNA-directed RNA polymerase subunit beta' [Desulfamplus magnetovallimortis]SLM27785.1 DNA-directed RNA polymerase subunit beta' [Desulfamplus magnetovallimortis]